MLAGSAAFIILCLTSCSAVGLDPKAPSEGNFKKAIDQYLAANPSYGKDCFNLNGTLPYDLPRRQDDPTLKALEAAGLLHSSDVMAVTGNHLPGYNPGPEPVKRFEATEAGRKFFSPAEQVFGPPSTQVCWANIRVDTIVKWFNEPADGSMAVNWTYQLTDVPDWAKRPEAVAGIPQIKDRMEQQKKRVRGALLKLSNQGWDVSHIYWDANQ